MTMQDYQMKRKLRVDPVKNVRGTLEACGLDPQCVAGPEIDVLFTILTDQYVSPQLIAEFRSGVPALEKDAVWERVLETGRKRAAPQAAAAHMQRYTGMLREFMSAAKNDDQKAMHDLFEKQIDALPREERARMQAHMDALSSAAKEPNQEDKTSS